MIYCNYIVMVVLFLFIKKTYNKRTIIKIVDLFF